jgi:hypothetical protein
VVGQTTGDAHFSFVQGDGVKPFDLDVAQMFGHSPKTIMRDETVVRRYEDATYSVEHLDDYLNDVLQLEAVACKDWLTNKVDRSVTGKIARQQTQGQLQLPLSDCGVVALDYRGEKGIAAALGHAPSGRPRRPRRRQRAECGRESDQHRVGTHSHRQEPPLAGAEPQPQCQLDVALAAARKVRMPVSTPPCRP